LSRGTPFALAQNLEHRHTIATETQRHRDLAIAVTCSTEPGRLAEANDTATRLVA
jgi:hypothetical protein